MASASLLVVAGLVLAVGFTIAAPLSETRPMPKDVARAAVDSYNEQMGTEVVFKFHQLRNVKRKNFGWGVHFSINFTIKETDCRKPVVYNVQDCKYRSKGKIKDCFAEATVLDFMEDAPLTSVECHQQQQREKPKQPASPNAKKLKAKSQPPVSPEDAEITVQYYVSAYSTAALVVPDDAGTD